MTEVSPGQFRKNKDVGSPPDVISFSHKNNPTDFSPSKSTVEIKLNQTETFRLEYLRRCKISALGIQAITLRLANRLKFSPDFHYIDAQGRLTFEDVKGGHVWEDSRIKIKQAASLYPWAKFLVVTRSFGDWDIEEIKP